MTSKLSESDIRAQVRDYLRMKGWFCFHLLAGLGCYPGLSDLVAVKDGRVLFIELKTKTGRQGKKQKEFEADLTAHGGEYLLCRGIEDLEGEGI